MTVTELPSPSPVAASAVPPPCRVSIATLKAENPLPIIAPGTVDPTSLTHEDIARLARVALDRLNAALATDDVVALKACLYPTQAFWRDSLALTWHLRCFSSPAVAAAALLENKKLRGLDQGFSISGNPTLNPELSVIDCDFTFRTSSPAATCSGRALLLPHKDAASSDVQWKIWIIYTRLESLDVHPENEQLLRIPGRKLDSLREFETDVLIIGAGNSGVVLAARLKALGVESAIIERNPRAGDNWALRYECLQFHVPTSAAQMPYLPYDDEYRDKMLDREALAKQLGRLVEEFHLNVIASAKILSTTYDIGSGRWTVKVQTPAGIKTAVARHLVQATGIGSQKPYKPQIADEALYKGISIHSTEYLSPDITLRPKDAKKILVVGSANTAFDILRDVHLAGLEATMVVRSPTFIFPAEYLSGPSAMGKFSTLDVDTADAATMSFPAVVEAQLTKLMFTSFASAEPDRYKALAAAGFPVMDGAHPDTCLLTTLLERGGGHYVDIGATSLIAERKVGIKANTEPIAFTETGVRFADGTEMDADAVVWCTGFQDKDAQKLVLEILESPSEAAATAAAVGKSALVLGPREVAARMDPTWGVDGEGEIVGIWKRSRALEADGVNYWVIGGATPHHRYHSKTVALQIKAELEGLLPRAYRETPAVEA